MREPCEAAEEITGDYHGRNGYKLFRKKKTENSGGLWRVTLQDLTRPSDDLPHAMAECRSVLLLPSFFRALGRRSRCASGEWGGGEAPDAISSHIAAACSPYCSIGLLHQANRCAPIREAPGPDLPTQGGHMPSFVVVRKGSCNDRFATFLKNKFNL